MTAASIVLAVTLIGFALWLESRERDEPRAGDNDPTFDDVYLAARQRGRRAVHVLLAIAGILIAIAGLAGQGPVWVAMWLAVCGLLIIVLMLGLWDFYRTNRYLVKKMPQLRKQILDAARRESGAIDQDK